MRIEELSIGDWVCAKLAKWESDDADMTPPLQVKRIDGIERHNLYVELFNPESNTIEHSAFVEDLIPIPLTPEILEKNGFKKNGEYNEWNIGEWNERPFIGVSLDRQSMRITHLGTDIFVEHQVVCVHQLQHALRLACVGKEIEV